MTMDKKINAEEILDPDVIELLGSDLVPADIAVQYKTRIRERVMARVDTEEGRCSPYVTIRADEGEWVEIGPLMEKKVLGVDQATGMESYLMRLHPGAATECHEHNEDELCIVLEGDVSFDDIHLQAGDYHLARKGSWHGGANTAHGALLFLQSASSPAQASA